LGELAYMGNLCESMVIPASIKVPTDVIRQVASIEVELIPWE
jgi:hypothetical protein